MMKHAELLELRDAVRGFCLEELLNELIQTPIPFVDFVPEARKPRRNPKKNSVKPPKPKQI
jgi:hypothetical protein